MNNVQLLGRLARDPEVRHTNGDNSMAVARFTVACDRRTKKNEEHQADFISCVAFGKTAEFIERYFFKGSAIALTGSIQTGSYTNKEGNKVYTTDIIVDSVEFAGSKNDRGPAENQTKTDDGFMNIPDDIDEDLPFA